MIRFGGRTLHDYPERRPICLRRRCLPSWPVRVEGSAAVALCQEAHLILPRQALPSGSRANFGRTSALQFFRGLYTAKLWGINLTNSPPTGAGQRISPIDLQRRGAPPVAKAQRRHVGAHLYPANIVIQSMASGQIFTALWERVGGRGSSAHIPGATITRLSRPGWPHRTGLLETGGY